MFPEIEQFIFIIRTLLAVLDDRLGPHVPRQSRISFDRAFQTSGLNETLHVINLLFQRGSFLLAQCPLEVEYCETLEQAIHRLLFPRILQTLMLMRLALRVDGRIDHTTLWRGLWGGSPRALHMNLENVWQLHRSPPESQNDVQPRSSGHGYDVRFMELPDVCITLS